MRKGKAVSGKASRRRHSDPSAFLPALLLAFLACAPLAADEDHGGAFVPPLAPPPEQAPTMDRAPRPSAFCRQKAPSGDPSGGAVKTHAAETWHDIEIPAGKPFLDRKIAEYSSPGGRAWLQTVLRRARPYEDWIRERIAARGLPQELFYLPLIESEWSPIAVSRSGAAGLWQFMMNSIGGYGLVVDEWRDDRRDFQKSTDAALRKLEWNYRRFGDWQLAIAAYNCGAGAMDRAIAKAGSRDFWTLSEGGWLPKETVSYLPKFLAVCAVARYGGRLGMEADWPEPRSWELVEPGRAVDISLLSERTGIPLEALREGNPELRYGVTPSGKGYALKVPSGGAEAVRKALADPSLPWIRYHIYTVKGGDTLSALSRHYGVSVAMIQSHNPGIKATALRIGGRLLIPALKEVTPYQGKPLVDPGTPFDGRYTVQKGDSLWAISLKYGLSPELLAERNGLALSSLIHAGLVLKVPIIKPYAESDIPGRGSP